MRDALIQGLHETVLTHAIRELLARELRLTRNVGTVDDEDQAHILTRHISAAVMQRLEAVRDPAKRLELAQRVPSTASPRPTSR